MLIYSVVVFLYSIDTSKEIIFKYNILNIDGKNGKYKLYDLENLILERENYEG